MKRLLNVAARLGATSALWTLCSVLVLSGQALAQGVTTGAMAGVVTNTQMQPVQGASVIAIHEPSGTTYEAVTRADGRFAIVAMRVGGPYSLAVNYVGAGAAFEPRTVTDLAVTLGVATDVNVQVRPIAVQETVTVMATAPDAVFSSSRTGASTAVTRADVAALPTISGRISDLTRLTPQSNGNSFAGQDNRLNNITVDGSFFNSAFGLGEGQPGGRTSVAPISLESIEQLQVSIAPFDVRQGNFVGAAVNTVTRSGTNELTGSFYHRFRSNDFVGTETSGQVVNPGTFTFRNTGGWAGGPVVKNRLFVFGNYENEKDIRPLTTFRANKGGEPATGSVTRVLASDMSALSSFLDQRFGYQTGPFDELDDVTPVKRYLLRGDLNLSNQNKVSFRYTQLDSQSRSYLSSSTSAGIGRPTFSSNFLSFNNSSYDQLEKIKSGVGEWNTVLGNSMSNNLIVGLTSNNENRGGAGELFPFVDILGPDGTAYASFGSEPFTPNNELRYKTFQFQDNFTKFGARHSLTFGTSFQRYSAENVFWSCCPQSSYLYNSLQDFYTDANDYLANPNRTTSPVTLRSFKLRYSNYPGLDKPLQELQVWYGGGYAQDEWRPSSNLTVTAGLRVDVPYFKNTAYQNAKADLLTFRDETGAAVKYQTGKMPDATPLWSPRIGFNWDPASNQRTQVRGGTGVFTGQPLFVWISNQLGNTGVLIGEIIETNTVNRPFNPDPKRYWPTNVTGEGAASFELNVTNPDFKFPQVWRTNFGIDQRLPWNMTGTAEVIYNKDVNGVYYINANLPAAQTTFVGADARPRWTSNRLNNTTPNIITSAIVMKNQSVGKSWNLSGSLSKVLAQGFTIRGAYSYGVTRNTIDPGSTAFGSWAGNQQPADPNNPGLGYSGATQGHRVFVQTSYTRSYFGFGSTTIAAFWEARPSANGSASATNASYVFAGDMNGDGASGNDLIYIPRNISEMNFSTFTQGGVTFTAEQQAQAFEAYINQDAYLKKHRGEYAERGALVFPTVKRLDLSITQDVFHNIKGKRNAGQFRIDFTNFGNLLNHNWGTSQRTTVGLTSGANGAQILTNPTVDAAGRSTYRLAVASGQLVTKSFTPNTSVGDVFNFMLSFRYSFN